MDGYVKQQRENTTTLTTSTSIPGSNPAQSIVQTFTLKEIESSPYYFHQNWGYDGRGHGYYVAGTFDRNNGPDLESDTRSGEEDNFQYNNEIFPNIYK
jgi:hypothetical protein